jgi:hypothetical protein
MIGKYCMVRTKSAGVFAGTVVTLEGQTATLNDARRIWYWSGAASLSQLATDGTSKPKNCKFPDPVAAVMLFEVIEIIPITEVAKASIASVPTWKL